MLNTSHDDQYVILLETVARSFPLIDRSKIWEVLEAQKYNVAEVAQILFTLQEEMNSSQNQSSQPQGHQPFILPQPQQTQNQPPKQIQQTQPQTQPNQPTPQQTQNQPPKQIQQTQPQTQPSQPTPQQTQNQPPKPQINTPILPQPSQPTPQQTQNQPPKQIQQTQPQTPQIPIKQEQPQPQSNTTDFDSVFMQEFERLRLAQSNSAQQKSLLDSSFILSKSQIPDPASNIPSSEKIKKDYHATLDASIALMEKKVTERDKTIAQLKQEIELQQQQKDSLSKSIMSLSSMRLSSSQPEKSDPVTPSTPSTPSTPAPLSQPSAPTQETPSYPVLGQLNNNNNNNNNGYYYPHYQQPMAYANHNPYYYQGPPNPHQYPPNFGYGK
jgi:hypothetical protein